MRLAESWWASLVYVFDFATFSTPTGQDAPQYALKLAPSADGVTDRPVLHPHGSSLKHADSGEDLKIAPSNPPHEIIINPPYLPPDGENIWPEHHIQCDYSKMGRDWKACNGPNNRGCWLKGPNGQEYNIDTDYDDSDLERKLAPLRGVTRKYTLDVSSKALAPDGVPMAHAKVFNDTYPGPWIQACWGDTVEITVRNNLRYNGTTIHWHGIRMLNNAENDGVNGVTQCPIAPGQELTYKFNTTQYGTSWYHSHYSLQYADGMAGPLTVYGPSSENYDYAEEPILMTDWNHRSAFEDWSYSLLPGKSRPKMTNILLNGLGVLNQSQTSQNLLLLTKVGRYVDPKTNETVVETKRYTKTFEKVGSFSSGLRD